MATVQPGFMFCDSLASYSASLVISSALKDFHDIVTAGVLQLKHLAVYKNVDKADFNFDCTASCQRRD